MNMVLPRAQRQEQQSMPEPVQTLQQQRQQRLDTYESQTLDDEQQNYQSLVSIPTYKYFVHFFMCCFS